MFNAFRTKGSSATEFFRQVSLEDGVLHVKDTTNQVYCFPVPTKSLPMPLAMLKFFIVLPSKSSTSIRYPLIEPFVSFSFRGNKPTLIFLLTALKCKCSTRLRSVEHAQK